MDMTTREYARQIERWCHKIAESCGFVKAKGGIAIHPFDSNVLGWLSFPFPKGSIYSLRRTDVSPVIGVCHVGLSDARRELVGLPKHRPPTPILSDSLIRVSGRRRSYHFYMDRPEDNELEVMAEEIDREAIPWIRARANWDAILQELHSRAWRTPGRYENDYPVALGISGRFDELARWIEFNGRPFLASTRPGDKIYLAYLDRVAARFLKDGRSTATT